ncbi:MAG: choice-of-anchor J domain-containing protein [Bacteroidales bacterium]|nr:choice-of-anchor J domain-containing protein [Bacteroidales bacterium]
MKRILLILIAAIFTFSANAQIFSDDFQDEDASDWTTVSPNYATNAYNWHISDYEGSFYLSVAAFDGSNNLATVQWMISPAFDATGVSDIDITFDNRGRYLPLQNLEVYVSTDFAGDSASFDAATWTQVTGFTWDDSYDDYDWVTGSTSSTSITGTATTYLAFKYVSEDGGDGYGGNWTIDNVVVDESSSINQINSNLRIFPNPTTSILNINSNSNINKIVVSNVIGQRIINISNIDSKNYSLEVESLTNGVYLINIVNIDGTSSITKFIKE